MGTNDVGTELVRLDSVSKHFSGVAAVKDVSLTVRRGEIHVLLGENGAGKSTLIKMLAGAHQPDGGTITVAGERVVIDSAHRAHELGIATIFQEFNLVPELSVAENILLGRAPRRMGFVDHAATRRIVMPLLERVGLKVNPSVKVSRLGLAGQQLVEIAKALSLDAKVLILDEPTAALTDQETERLFEVMNSLRDSGVAQIFISHHLNEVTQMGDRVTVLRDGVSVAELPAGTPSAELVRLMVGRPIDSQFPPRPDEEPGDVLLRVDGLTREGDFEDVSFEVRAGEVVGLAGLVGAGRTEVIRAIAGADRYDSGTIEVAGRPLKGGNVRAAVAQGIGHVPESRKTQGLVLDADVAANVTLANLPSYTRSGFVARHRLRSDAASITKKLRVRMRGLAQQVKSLSGGNQQKVVFGKWILAGSKVLLLDEPTRGVDVGARVEIYELVNKLVADGGAVLMVSSDLPEVLGVADRVLVMSEGRIVGAQTTQEATQESIMRLAVKEVESSRVH
jgi:ribose transport system ATP-binding protein